jgi:CheY-like chemotaxis protein
METLLKFIEVITDLFIPLSVFILIITNIKTIKDLLLGLKNRMIKLEIGGNKIEIGEAFEQQNNIIKDMQKYLADNINDNQKIQKNISDDRLCNRILWVDDFPNNNIMLEQTLKSDGFNIDKALSTKEALQLYKNGKYDIIISDMERIENGINRREAGIELFNNIRNSDKDISMIIYTSYTEEKEYFDAINSLQSKITSSSTELLNIIYKLNKNKNNCT